MSKKLPSTPRSKVRAALRQLSLRSRERAAAMKREHYTCERCGVKQSKAKGHEVAVEGHHKSGRIDWDFIIDEVFRVLLVPQEEWEILCTECHKKETEERR